MKSAGALSRIVDQSAPVPSELAGALHEVSNALTVVLGWLEVAYGRLPAGPERAALEVAKTHAQLGYRLARQAIGAECPNLQGEERLARWVADHAVLGVMPKAEAKNVRVVFSDEHDGNALVAPLGPLIQILTNLLLNAVEFSPSGGKVTVVLRDQGDKLVFSVSDEGPGIDPARVAGLLIEPVSTRRGGAGLGLRHSARLAREHGGSLIVSRAQPGACFDLTWPITERCSNARPKQDPKTGLEGTRILVVDDDAAVCSLLDLALEAKGAQVVTADSADALAALLHTNLQFDVALVDLSPLGEQIGAYLQQIRAKNPEAVVILISGIASGVPHDVAEAVDEWVRKPFEVNEVVAAIGRTARHLHLKS